MEKVAQMKPEPIAEKLGVDYPFPPHLEYAYPPPDGNILTNIVNALIAVPRFYTQVLHLMNKMNIPALFRMALPTPPLPSAPAPVPPPLPLVTEKPHPGNLSSDESEMETSDEFISDLVENFSKRLTASGISWHLESFCLERASGLCHSHVRQEVSGSSVRNDERLN